MNKLNRFMKTNCLIKGHILICFVKKIPNIICFWQITYCK
jgi:hypothetical protein